MTKKLEELFELTPAEIDELRNPIPEGAREITTEAYSNLEKIPVKSVYFHCKLGKCCIF